MPLRCAMPLCLARRSGPRPPPPPLPACPPPSSILHPPSSSPARPPLAPPDRHARARQSCLHGPRRRRPDAEPVTTAPPPPRRGHGKRSAMSDTEDASRARDTSRAADADDDDSDVAQLEGHAAAPALVTPDGPEPTPSRGRGPCDDGSEASSLNASLIDAVPRRAGSPADSLASPPAGSPSIQVRRPGPPAAPSRQPADSARAPPCRPPPAACCPWPPRVPSRAAPRRPFGPLTAASSPASPAPRPPPRVPRRPPSTRRTAAMARSPRPCCWTTRQTPTRPRRPGKSCGGRGSASSTPRPFPRPAAATLARPPAWPSPPPLSWAPPRELYCSSTTTRTSR